MSLSCRYRLRSYILCLVLIVQLSVSTVHITLTRCLALSRYLTLSLSDIGISLCFTCGGSYRSRGGCASTALLDTTTPNSHGICSQYVIYPFILFTLFLTHLLAYTAPHSLNRPLSLSFTPTHSLTHSLTPLNHLPH